MPIKDAENKPFKLEQVREMETEELSAELARLREARFRLKFRAATESIEQTASARTLRRNIARLETVLRERVKA